MAEQAAAYVIFLLVPHWVFAFGLAVLRQMQSGDEARITAQEVGDKYQHRLASACAGRAMQFFPPTGRFVPHDLRALCTHVIMATFESRYAFNQTTNPILGHEGLQESLKYSSVIIGKNASLPRFGLLLV